MAETYYESVGTYNASGDLSIKIKKSFLSINGGRNFFSGFDLNDSTRSMEFKPKEQYNAGLKYNFNIKKVNLTLKSDFFNEQLLTGGDTASFAALFYLDTIFPVILGRGRVPRVNYFFLLSR